MGLISKLPTFLYSIELLDVAKFNRVEEGNEAISWEQVATPKKEYQTQSS